VIFGFRLGPPSTSAGPVRFNVGLFRSIRAPTTCGRAWSRGGQTLLFDSNRPGGAGDQEHLDVDTNAGLPLTPLTSSHGVRRFWRESSQSLLERREERTECSHFGSEFPIGRFPLTGTDHYGGALARKPSDRFRVTIRLNGKHIIRILEIVVALLVSIAAPAQGQSWIVTGSMSVERVGHAAVLLADGRGARDRRSNVGGDCDVHGRALRPRHGLLDPDRQHERRAVPVTPPPC